MRPKSRSVRAAAGVGVCAVAIVSVATLSAHRVKSLDPAGAATAFVSSPSAGSDAPIAIKWGTQASGDSGVRVICFHVANSSPERTDRPGWPRVTGAGFELPGARTGFALLEPLDGNWELVEGARAILNDTEVTLDVAVVARTNPTGRTPGSPDNPRGIPPGQPGVPASGPRFCVSGPFPPELVSGQPTTIEQILNGVVVGFHGVEGTHQGTDVGIWDNAARFIPLYQ